MNSAWQAGAETSLADWGRQILSWFNSLEGRAFLIIVVFRFLLMPFVGIFSLSAISALGLLPPKDDLYRMVILMFSAMPPAQNHIILFNLQPKTRPLVPYVARMTAATYLVSVLPVTLWVTSFSSIS